MKYVLSVACLSVILFASCVPSNGEKVDHISLTPSNTNESSVENVNQNLDETSSSALEERKKLEESLETAKGLVAEAKSMDYAKQQDEIRARLAKAKAAAETLVEIDDFFIEADSLIQRVAEVEQRLENFVQVTDLPVHLDLSSKFGGDLVISELTKSNGNIVAIANKGVYGPLQDGNTEGISEVVFDAGVLGNSGAFSLKFRNTYVSTSPGKVYAYTGDKLVAQEVEEGQWYPASELRSYGSNLYLLDPINNALWKYEKKSGNIWQKPTRALDHPEFANGNVISIAIDIHIYALTKDGRILKFTGGELQEIEVDASLTGLSSDSVLYANVNSANLYFYDPVGGRMIRFGERINALKVDKEYTVPGSYSGLYIPNVESEAYLHNGKQIYKMSL